MKLNTLLEQAGRHERSDDAAPVTGFAIDHRKVAPGTIFGAFEGASVNGEDFIDAAIAAGAVAIVARGSAKVEVGNRAMSPATRVLTQKWVARL